MRGRTLLVITALLAFLLVHSYVVKMDTRWFAASPAGVKGLLLYQVGDYDGAAVAYRDHLRQLAARWYPEDLAWGALLRGDLETAAAESHRALGEAPDAVGPALTLSEVDLERGEFVRAKERVAGVLARHPDEVDALLLSAVIYARLGQDDLAIDAFSRVLRSGEVETRRTVFLWTLQAAGELLEQPSESRQWCLLAHVFRYLRIYDPANGGRAIRYAKRAIASGDRPADAYLTIGVVRRKQGHPDKALAAFLEATRLDPKHAEAYRWAATIYAEQGDLLREYQMARAAFDSGANDPFYVKPLDYVLVEKLGDVKQAADLFEQALLGSPDNVRLHDRLGYAYAFLGDHQRSRAAYERALDLEPANPSLHEGLAFSLDRMGMTDEALERYEQAALLDPNRYEPHTAMAGIYYGLRQFERALSEYQTAFELGETDLNAQTQLCGLYHLVSNFEQAAACLRSVLRRDPNHTLALRLWAETQRNLEQ